MTDSADSWRRAMPFAPADWQKWFAGAGAAAGPAMGPSAAAAASGAWLDPAAATAAYTELARELARFAELARSAVPPQAAAAAAGGATAGGAAAPQELLEFAQRLFSQALPRWQGAEAAAPEWARALASMNAVLADAARDAATRYAGLLRGEVAPSTLRGLIDAWIDCAEAAFQSAAHTERYASAQAALLNEFVTLRGRQQELAEWASRALGQPTRAEVDALHATLRELKGELDALRAAGAAPSGAPAEPPATPAAPSRAAARRKSAVPRRAPRRDAKPPA